MVVVAIGLAFESFDGTRLLREAGYLITLHVDTWRWPASDGRLLDGGYQMCDAMRKAKADSKGMVDPLAMLDHLTAGADPSSDGHKMNVMAHAAVKYLCSDAA